MEKVDWKLCWDEQYHVESNNMNGKGENSANAPKLKKRNDSASSKTRLRVEGVVRHTPTHQHPCTLLSWLIDNNVVLPREKVRYSIDKGSLPMARGRISRKGIKCNCCHKIFTLGDFQTHAGCKNHRPAANIFLDNGKSLLDCQIQLVSKMRKESCRSEPHGEMNGNWRVENDCICSVCEDGGDLVLCDLCPSAFHMSCIRLKDVPDGDWFCTACCCRICDRGILKEDRETNHYRTCCQCDHKYHTRCLTKSVVKLESDPTGNWFCSETCQNIRLGLHEYLGKQIPVGVDKLTWSLLKRDDMNQPDNDTIAETYSRLYLALEVMHECFKFDKEPHTQSDLAEDIIFSRGSNLDRVNFQGFYTMLLEKNDELISVATVRIYGAQVAEVPLLGTRIKYRRRGMFRKLLHLLEKMLMNLGVEKLVLSTIPSVVNQWTKFGFSKMTYSQRLKFLDYRFVDFQGTILCQKCLMKISDTIPDPAMQIECIEVSDDSSAACEATDFKNVTVKSSVSSEQIWIEISDTSTDHSSKIEYVDAPDVSPSARNATSLGHETALGDAASSEQVHVEISDPMKFNVLANIKKDYVALLEEVISLHPSLIERQRPYSPQFAVWAFTKLGEVLHFFKTRKADMTEDDRSDLKQLWNELEFFKFDLTWLVPQVKRALGMSMFVEREVELLNRLREDMNTLKAKLLAVRKDLKMAEEGFDETFLDSELEYPGPPVQFLDGR